MTPKPAAEGPSDDKSKRLKVKENVISHLDSNTVWKRKISFRKLEIVPAGKARD